MSKFKYSVEDINEYDELSLFYGADFIVNEKIRIRQPYIQEIIDYGERNYYSLISSMTSIPSDMKSELWDKYKINYCKISNFELFIRQVSDYTVKDTSILFGDTLDFSKMKLKKKVYEDQSDENAEKEFCLYDVTNEIMIDEFIYLKIVGFLRKMHNLKADPDIVRGKASQMLLIDEDRTHKELHKGEKYKSTLLPLISTLVNSEGFKYSKEDLCKVNYLEFMDSVKRIPKISTSKSIMNGMYGGMLDLSKNPALKKELNMFG